LEKCLVSTEKLLHHVTIVSTTLQELTEYINTQASFEVNRLCKIIQSEYVWFTN